MYLDVVQVLAAGCQFVWQTSLHWLNVEIPELDRWIGNIPEVASPRVSCQLIHPGWSADLKHHTTQIGIGRDPEPRQTSLLVCPFHQT